MRLVLGLLELTILMQEETVNMWVRNAEVLWRKWTWCYGRDTHKYLKGWENQWEGGAKGDLPASYRSDMKDEGTNEEEPRETFLHLTSSDVESLPLTVLGPHEINCLQRNIWFTVSHCLEKPFWVQTSISLSPCLSSTSFLPTCYWQLTVFGPLVHPVYLQLPASVCLRFYSEGTENGEQAGKLTLLAFLMTVGSKQRSCRHLNDTADEQKGRCAEDRWPSTWNMSASVTTQPHLLCTPYSPC